MSAQNEEEEFINFNPVITSYGRVTQPRIQIPNSSVEVSSAEGPSQGVISESSYSHQSNDNNSVLEDKSVSTSRVNLFCESSVNQLCGVHKKFNTMLNFF